MKRKLLRLLTEGHRVKGQFTSPGCYYFMNKNAELKFCRQGIIENVRLSLNEFLDYYCTVGAMVSDSPEKEVFILVGAGIGGDFIMGVYDNRRAAEQDKDNFSRKYGRGFCTEVYSRPMYSKAVIAG